MEIAPQRPKPYNSEATAGETGALSYMEIAPQRPKPYNSEAAAGGDQSIELYGNRSAAPKTI